MQYTNYNNYQYAQIPNARPVTVVQQSPLYAQNEQIPINEIKYNNKKNKNLSNKSKKQNKKNDDIDLDEEEPEDINRINEIKNNNNNINEFSMINNNNNLVVDNVPQIINSFYYINNNNVQVPQIERNNNFNETSINYNEDLNNNMYSINNNASLKYKKLKKPKPKKYNCIFNKNTLQVLENMTITNEDKLIFILNNFQNIKIDPLIIKVLEERKTKKRIGYYESILSEEQNTSSANERERSNTLNNTGKKPELNSQNNIQNDRYASPQPIPKPQFPMDDKILFANLEKYNISEEILDRPLPQKIDLDFHMLNKLFIVWDFVTTFKDIVFTDRVCSNIEIDKNILVFYNELINEKNDFEYYKNIYVSLLLICVKNIDKLTLCGHTIEILYGII